MDVPTEIKAMQGEMTEWRRDFHSHPELGFEEVRTSRIVAERLQSWGLEVHRGLGKTGVVGVLKGRPGNASIGLRADMDALAMEEANVFGHRSTTPNRMHACGHDGHTAMLLGAAKYLAQTRNFAGTVNFIFQPAEEGLAGAKAMVDDGLFDQFPCDSVYGIHNDPSTPLGLVNVRAGGMLAAVDYFVIHVRGVGCHGGQPHRGIDPISASAHILTVLQTIVARNVSPTDTAVISIGQIHAGTHDIVIPDIVEIRGSVRTLKPETRDLVEHNFKRAVHSTAQAQGCVAEIEYRRAYPPTINTPDEAAIASSAASKIVGEKNILGNEPSWTAGEDFAFMLEKRPGAYLFFGQKEPERGGAALHNPEYDFNDNLLPLGAGFFARLTEQVLG
jgi:amidohydrolase